MISSYNSPDSLKGLSGVFIGLGIITAVLRFCIRGHQKLPMLMDDWLVIPATLTFIGAAICTIWGVEIKQLGYSAFDFQPGELAATNQLMQQLVVAFDICIVISLACTKMSALYFYKRIFCVNGRKGLLRMLINSTVVIIVLWTIAFCLLPLLQCGTHYSALWDGDYNKYCHISIPFIYGLTISEFLLDVWVLMLPIPVIVQLHTSASKKISIICIFLLAYAGLGASIARLVIFTQNFREGVDENEKPDPSASLSTSFFYVILEAGICIVAVNLPSLWIVFASMAPEKLILSLRNSVLLTSRRHSTPESNNTLSGGSKKEKDLEMQRESISVDSSVKYAESEQEQSSVHAK